MDYSSLAIVYDKISLTSKRLEKTKLICDLLKSTPQEELNTVIRLLQGKIFAEWEEKKIGVNTNYVIKALSKISGLSEPKIKDLWKTIGDLGEVSLKVLENKGQSTLFVQKLSINQVLENLQKLALETGNGSVDRKIGIISNLLSNANGYEAKFLVRTILEDLRVGVSSGTIRDAIVWAFLYEVGDDLIIKNREDYGKIINIIDDAYNRANDFGIIAMLAKEGIEKLKKVSLIPGKPIKVMLAQKERSIESAFNRVGRPAILEHKLDGFRTQIHKLGAEVKLFTRRLDEVTNQFPDVVEAIKKNVTAKYCILDSEIVGIKEGKYQVFQNISQRIRRKHGISEMVKKLPVEINIFDIMSIEQKDIINIPLIERINILEKTVKPVKNVIKIVERIITDDEKEAQEFFEKSIALGHEGLMFKNTESVYNPGSRVGSMVKLKNTQDTIDLVIIGGEWGTGKRSGWITSLNLACYDAESGEFLAIGKVGTGLKEKREEGLSFDEITELLKPLIVQEIGREVLVKPSIVIEIEYEELQASTNYESGFALRFPRVKTLRDDRKAVDCTTLEQVRSLSA